MVNADLISMIPSTNTTFGALFIGSTFSSICWGITNVQVLIYCASYPKDTRINKIAVALLWCLDTIHFAVSTEVVYHYLIVRGITSLPTEITWSVRLQVAINVLIVLIVQSLYAMRVWKLSDMHHGLLGYLSAGVILLGFVVGVVLAYEVWVLDSFANIQSISWAIIACFSTAAGIDMTIAIAIFICVRRTQIVVPNLSNKLMTITVYSMISGLLTTVCAIAALLAYLFMPHNFVFYSLGFVLTRLYINSFLSLLNARPRTPPENPTEKHAQPSPILPLTSLPLSARGYRQRYPSCDRYPKNEFDSPTEGAPSTFSFSGFSGTPPQSALYLNQEGPHLSYDSLPRAL